MARCQLPPPHFPLAVYFGGRSRFYVAGCRRSTPWNRVSTGTNVSRVVGGRQTLIDRQSSRRLLSERRMRVHRHKSSSVSLPETFTRVWKKCAPERHGAINKRGEHRETIVSSIARGFRCLYHSLVAIRGKKGMGSRRVDLIEEKVNRDAVVINQYFEGYFIRSHPPY